MEKEKLLKGLADYGYPLFQPFNREAPEAVLENLLKQDEARLLEGFPVVFSRMLREKKRLAWEQSRWRPEQGLSKRSRSRLAPLLALTYHLFRLFGMEPRFQKRTQKLLFRFKEGKEWLSRLRGAFMESMPVTAGDIPVSLERMKNNFKNYVLLEPEDRRAQKKEEDLEFELLLSELFTARQKELLRKRLEGRVMTKTEREYYYRVVKKRLKALADERLHQLARRFVFR